MKRNKMNILVVESIDNTVLHKQDYINKSKNIICPKCKEDIKFKIEDYVINLFECKNKHDIDNIFLNEFDSTQNINISKIICQNCGKYNKSNVHNNIFYKCNNCKKIYVLYVIQIMIKIII
jgi:DNA-directed RNA polymerase subunit M/transcription elongation factor TFIIS